MASGYVPSTSRRASLQLRGVPDTNKPRSSSSRDLFKALNSILAGPTNVRCLPEEVQQTVHAYLDKHEDPDASDSQKLQDELKHLYSKHVVEDNARLGVFLHALRLLHPAIRGANRKLEWWDLVLKDVLDNVGHRRDEIEYATDFLLDLMSYDADLENAQDLAKQSAVLLKRLLSAYMRRTRVKDAQSEPLTLEDGYISQQIEAVLVAYGRRKPKDLMLALDALVLAPETRLQALSLLAAFVRHQPPHLYTVRDTPLFEHLLKCLLIDTSTTVIQIALTILVMFLPHIPSSVRKHLPTLFLVYTRLLCWDKLFQASSDAQQPTASVQVDVDSITHSRSSSSPNPSVSVEHVRSNGDSDWDKLESLMPDPESNPPNLTYLFTFLYGLYPLNFLSYVRKPRKYLKSVGYPRADEVEFDQLLIRQRTEKYRKFHQMHPNLFSTTLEDELEDDRWEQSDPADVVTECMALCIDLTASAVPRTHATAPSASSRGDEMPADFVRTEDIPAHPLTVDHEENGGGLMERAASPAEERSTSRAAYSSAMGPTLSRKSSQRSTRTPLSQHSVFESPVLAAIESPPLHPHQAQSAALKPPASGRVSATSSSQLRLDATKQAASRSPAIAASSQELTNTALLQREVMFLRNDLNFERYLKQQHLSHIGQLQGRLIKEATSEANLQMLIQTNKTLQAKLTKANDSYASLKKETATGRSNSKKFETELSSRVRSLRENERAWRIREEDLKVELQKAQTDCKHYRRLIVETEARELLGQQKLASMVLEVEQLGVLKSRNAELENKLRAYESRQIQYEEALTEVEILRTDLATAQLRLQSRESNAERAKQAMQDRIDELEVQLYDLQHGQGGALNPAIQEVLDQTMAEANRRVGMIRQDYGKLKQRYLELEQRIQGQGADSTGATASSSTSKSTGSTTPARPRRPDEISGDGSSIKSLDGASNRLSFYAAMGNRRSAGSAGSDRESLAPSPASTKAAPRKALSGGLSSLLARTSTPDTFQSGGSDADSFYSSPRSHFSDETLADDVKKDKKRKGKEFSNFFT